MASFASWLLASCVICGFHFDQESSERSEASARALIAEVLEALGGADAYRKGANARTVSHVQARVGPGELSVEMEITVYTQADGRRRAEKQVQGEVQTLGFDGRELWMTLAGGQATTMPETATRTVELDGIQQLIFLDYEKHGYTVRLAPPVREGDLTFDQLVFEKKGTEPHEKAGERLRFSIDAGSRRPVRIDWIVPDPFGRKDRPMTLVLEDYRTVSGVSIPHRVRHLRDGVEVMRSEIRTVVVGKTFGDSLFQRPKPKD